MQKECPVCNKFFEKPYNCSLKRWLERKTCSMKCKGISRRGIKTWSSTQKGIHLSPSSEFKKGMTPWNKGKNWVMPEPWNKHKKGIHLSKKSEFKKGDNSGEKNCNWKGDNVGISGLHIWVLKQKGNPEKCEHCGKIGEYYEYIRCGKTIKRWTIDWANIDHSYKRNIDDFIGLCTKCHRKYDIEHNNYDSHPLN